MITIIFIILVSHTYRDKGREAAAVIIRLSYEAYASSLVWFYIGFSRFGCAFWRDTLFDMVVIMSRVYSLRELIEISVCHWK